MKRFIYLMELKKRYPSFQFFLNYMKEKIEVEQLISLSKNRFGTHLGILKPFI